MGLDICGCPCIPVDMHWHTKHSEIPCCPRMFVAAHDIHMDMISIDFWWAPKKFTNILWMFNADHGYLWTSMVIHRFVISIRSIPMFACSSFSYGDEEHRVRPYMPFWRGAADLGFFTEIAKAMEIGRKSFFILCLERIWVPMAIGCQVIPTGLGYGSGQFEIPFQQNLS